MFISSSAGWPALVPKDPCWGYRPMPERPGERAVSDFAGKRGRRDEDDRATRTGSTVTAHPAPEQPGEDAAAASAHYQHIARIAGQADQDPPCGAVLNMPGNDRNQHRVVSASERLGVAQSLQASGRPAHPDDHPAHARHGPAPSPPPVDDRHAARPAAPALPASPATGHGKHPANARCRHLADRWIGPLHAAGSAQTGDLSSGQDAPAAGAPIEAQPGRCGEGSCATPRRGRLPPTCRLVVPPDFARLSGPATEFIWSLIAHLRPQIRTSRMSADQTSRRAVPQSLELVFDP